MQEPPRELLDDVAMVVYGVAVGMMGHYGRGETTLTALLVTGQPVIAVIQYRCWKVLVTSQPGAVINWLSVQMGGFGLGALTIRG